MTANIISVVNQKGGVGKTTSAINLASFLSESSYRTLLVDMDAQANATSGLGMELSRNDKTVYELLVTSISIDEVLFSTAFDNLHIVPSTKNLSGAEVEIVNVVSRETILLKKLEPILDQYDFIIIDCPPSLGLLTLNALVASKYTIIPVQTEYFALEGVASLINTLTLVQENFNHNLEILGIVLTMFDTRTSLNRQVVENTKRFFGELVFDAVIPRSIRLSESPSHGLPILLYSPDSKGSIAYYNFTQEVIKRV